MEKTPKEMMKAYVDSQKFNSTTEIMDAMKEMFRDVLQQVMESELDAELGYEKSQRTSETAVENNRRNYRNGYPICSKVNFFVWRILAHGVHLFIIISSLFV